MAVEELTQFFRDVIVPHGICNFQAEDLPVYDVAIGTLSDCSCQQGSFRAGRVCPTL